MENNTNTNNKHVVVLAFPYGTHAIPLLNLIIRLSNASPSTNFSFLSTSKSNLSTFSQKSNLPTNIKVYNVDAGIPDGFTGGGQNPMVEMELFLKSMDKNYRKGIDSVMMRSDARKISCFIADSFLWVVKDIAEEMNVPWISLWTAGACSLSTHYYTDLIRQNIKLGENGIAGREEECIDFVPGNSVLRVKDLQEGVIFGNLESEFSLMLLQMGRSLGQATAVMFNSFEELEQPVLDDLTKKFKKCLTVGPFALTSPSQSKVDDIHGCLPWLDTQKPTSVVYISFGTVTVPPPHELVALAEGLEEIGLPFIWSLKDHNKVHLPNGFLERTSGRGLVVPWAPQERILGHVSVGVFVTHCGWNSVLESVTAGIPMICRPFFGDQRINSRMVSDGWGIGIKMEDGGFTKEATIGSLQLVFYSETGKKMMEKVGSLRGLAKHAVSLKGSSSINFNTLLEIVSRN